MKTVTFTQRTIKITKPKDLPRKQKKKLKKAMSIQWYREDLDPNYFMIQL